MIKRLAAGLVALMITAVVAEAQCPSYKLRPIEGGTVLREGFPSDPRVYRFQAGGRLNLSGCLSVPGQGWIERRPDASIEYRTHNSRRSRQTLTFYLASSSDVVLLINDPNGQWHFDDDSGRGLNAKIRFPRARDGRYDVWIGTYDRGRLRKAALAVTELN